MCSSYPSRSSFRDSLPDRDVVRWLGIGRAVAEPQRTTAGVALDPNADNRGSCIVRKFCGLLELVAKESLPRRRAGPAFHTDIPRGRRYPRLFQKLGGRDLN
jgi:hypothetical protein